MTLAERWEEYARKTPGVGEKERDAFYVGACVTVIACKNGDGFSTVIEEAKEYSRLKMLEEQRRSR